jgi:hypothetical protein
MTKKLPLKSGRKVKFTIYFMRSIYLSLQCFHRNIHFHHVPKHFSQGPEPGATSYLSDLAGPVKFSPISKFRVNSLGNHLHAGSVKYVQQSMII